jgi:HEAT repeat protein
MAERVYDLAAHGDAQARWRAHAERAVEDVARTLGARVQLAQGSAEALVAAIEGGDSELRDEAIRLAGERRELAAVPSLVKLLRGDDHEARDREIGALAAIGDARAVRPLTEVARFRDLADLPKVLDALAAIGGDEARAYLEFVASGHDSPEIREMAKKALAHLDERRRRDLATAPR